VICRKVETKGRRLGESQFNIKQRYSAGCPKKPKDPVKTNQKTHAVYSIPCGDCEKEYLG
jgi:hypothetical protein